MNELNPSTSTAVLRRTAALVLLAFLPVASFSADAAKHASELAPRISKNESADWWFVFKFNGAQFPGCPSGAQRSCPFGGTVQDYQYGYGQRFVYASSNDPTLRDGGVCAGTTDENAEPDPLGATYAQIYDGDYYYVVWNDQFYQQPEIEGCSTYCPAPWGHSKGMVAWDEDGNGLVLQVTTPAWPGAGNRRHPRESGGNTLGCISLDDDISVAQHFFSLKLNKDDLKKVLLALANASVVTDISLPQLVNNGGPEDVQALVSLLGVQSHSTYVSDVELSSGVRLISKPSELHVPPWQLVSAKLGGVDLRAATWWDDPTIASTTRTTPISCWSDELGSPGGVTIATSGTWNGTVFSLKGGMGDQYNHAKFAVEEGDHPSLAIFGDMNQQGALAAGADYPDQKCSSSQNGRGGTFYVVDDTELANNLAKLIKGDSAPVATNP